MIFNSGNCPSSWHNPYEITVSLCQKGKLNGYFTPYPSNDFSTHLRQKILSSPHTSGLSSISVCIESFFWFYLILLETDNITSLKSSLTANLSLLHSLGLRFTTFRKLTSPLGVTHYAILVSLKSIQKEKPQTGTKHPCSVAGLEDLGVQASHSDVQVLNCISTIHGQRTLSLLPAPLH